MSTCTNWRLITFETDIAQLINCCLRKLLPNFSGDEKKWHYYTLRKIRGNQTILIEQLGDDCKPFQNADTHLSTVAELLGWEYCCDFLIKEFRESE